MPDPMRITFAALLLAASCNLLAQDAFETTCASLPPVSQADYFKDFAGQIHNAKALFCSKQPLDVPTYPDSFVNAMDHLKLVGARDEDLVSINQDLAGYLDKNEVPQMLAKSNGRIEMNLKPYTVVTDLGSCNVHAASLKTAGTCNEALEEFASIYNEGQQFYALYTAVKTKKQLVTLESEWDDFLQYSKSQTIWELAFNGWLYKNSEEASFKKPPAGQWILLHPGIVIESVPDAFDGEETKEALTLDVIGYNNWQRDEWYIPSGISYTLIYSDRAEVESWGNAVSLHFKSKYILGFSEHDGDEGWYVSIDLLDFLRDNKQQFDAYTSQF